MTSGIGLEQTVDSQFLKVHRTEDSTPTDRPIRGIRGIEYLRLNGSARCEH